MRGEMEIAAGKSAFVPSGPLLTILGLSHLDNCAHTVLKSNHCSGAVHQCQHMEMGGWKVQDIPELHSKFKARLD